MNLQQKILNNPHEFAWQALCRLHNAGLLETFDVGPSGWDIIMTWTPVGQHCQNAFKVLEDLARPGDRTEIADLVRMFVNRFDGFNPDKVFFGLVARRTGSTDNESALLDQGKKIGEILHDFGQRLGSLDDEDLFVFWFLLTEKWQSIRCHLN